jgi:hypothetical protein
MVVKGKSAVAIKGTCCLGKSVVNMKITGCYGKSMVAMEVGGCKGNSIVTLVFFLIISFSKSVFSSCAYIHQTGIININLVEDHLSIIPVKFG